MQLYKRVIILFFQALLVMPGLLSCTKENLVDDGGSMTVRPGNNYVYFKIETSDNVVSRADSDDLKEDQGGSHDSGDLVNGNDSEHRIGILGNYGLFFDSEDKLMAVAELELAREDDPVGDPEDGEQHVREFVYGTKIYIEEESDLPASCLVVLNGQLVKEKLEQSIGKNIGTVLDLTWAEEDPYSIGKNDSDYFTMTSSIYAEGSKIKSAVTISPDMIQEEGQFDEKKVIIVHVERMLAKFDFRIERNTDLQPEGESDRIYQPSTEPDIVLFDGFHIDGSPKYTAKRWRIELTGWALNALETESYLFKKVSTAGYGTYWRWNDPANFRTYWGEDVTYDDTRYPWQYRSAGYEPAENIPYYSATGADADGMTTLKNCSFEDLDLDVKSDDASAAHFNRTLYAPESTFKAESVRGKHDNRDEMLAATHLLLGARMQLEMDRNSGDYAAHDIFRERSGFFYQNERDLFAVQIHAFNQLLNSQKSMDYVYYAWDKKISAEDKIYDLRYDTRTNAEGKTEYVYNKGELRPIVNGDRLAAKPSQIETSEGRYNGVYDFHLYWIPEGADAATDRWKLLDDAFFETECRDMAEFRSLFGSLALGEIPHGDGKRLPWPVSGRLVICNSAFVPIDVYTRDLVVAGQPNRREYLRPASDNDVKSLLYEWLGATDHFNGGRMYYACGIEQDAGNYEMEDGSVVSRTGRYGTVRNNWYQFNLKSISGVGVPVDDPGQEIVPDRAGPNDQINVTVSILDWHYETTTTPVV